MKLVEELPGERGNDIYAIESDDGSVEARNYLEALRSAFPKVHKKLMAEIKHHAKKGISTNQEKSRPIKGEKYRGLFEFKANDRTGTARLIYCYHGRKRTVLLVGTEKTKPREFRQVADVALGLKALLDQEIDKDDNQAIQEHSRPTSRSRMGSGVRRSRT